MPKKIFEGLSLSGIAAQIVNSVTLYKKHKIGTRNDCQLVVNFLIRHYHNRLLSERKAKIRQTENAKLAIALGEKVYREHAIPVACIMAALIDDPRILDPELVAVLPSVEMFLLESAKLVLVSEKEAMQLKSAKLDHSMPVGHETPPWDEPFVRYRITRLSKIID